MCSNGDGWVTSSLLSVSRLLRAQGDLHLSGGPFPMATTLLGSHAILASLDIVKASPDGSAGKEHAL